MSASKRIRMISDQLFLALYVHYLYIALYTNSWSDIIRTLFEAHIVADITGYYFWKVLYISEVERRESTGSTANKKPRVKTHTGKILIPFLFKILYMYVYKLEHHFVLINNFK